MAPRRKWIDRKLLKELCLSQCSNEEIAGALRVSWDTLKKRYTEAIKIWRGEGPMSARRRLYSLGMKDIPITDKDGEIVGYKPASVPSLIFFLKNYGGMTDVVRNDQPLERGNLPTQFEAADVSGTDKPN
jgi:hypothetical protein